jgi:hypothetical protein
MAVAAGGLVYKACPIDYAGPEQLLKHLGDSMRFSAMILVLMLAGTTPAMANGSVSEPHALVYYQIPFSGDAPDTRAHFGLRLDRTVREAGQTVEFSALMPRPAVMDLRFGTGGLESFSFAGVDYLARYRALQADEEQKTTGDGTAKSGDKDAAEEDKLTMGKILDDAPVGYLIGAGIGLLLLGTSAAD